VGTNKWPSYNASELVKKKCLSDLLSDPPILESQRLWFFFLLLKKGLIIMGDLSLLKFKNWSIFMDDLPLFKFQKEFQQAFTLS
jgi:hypothetical protein